MRYSRVVLIKETFLPDSGMVYEHIQEKTMPMKIPVYFIILSCALLSAGDEPITSDCTCKEIMLHGKVKIVEHFPDFKVQVVEHFPDLKVKIVDNFPDECGEWELVDNFPDFEIQFVEHFPDFKIQFVDHFPGLP